MCFKTQVREIAEKHGFVNAQKHDSQDICFIQTGTYADFIEARLGRKFNPGNFVDEAGNVLGRHKGIIHYTVGQRKGLGLALPQPMYVKEIDTKKRYSQEHQPYRLRRYHRTAPCESTHPLPSAGAMGNCYPA